MMDFGSGRLWALKKKQGREEGKKMGLLFKKNTTNQQNIFQWDSWEHVESGLQIKGLFLWDLIN